jgi:hypothetical protein
MRISVEAWNPEYGGETELGAPVEVSVEQVDTAVEGRAWGLVDPRDPGHLCERPLGFVDGTRRIDARLFVSTNGGPPVPGVAASVGVGAVVCDPAPAGREGRRGPQWWTLKRAEVTEINVERFLAVGAGTDAKLPASPGLAYKPLPVPGYDLEDMIDAVHDQMRAAEAGLAQQLAATEGGLVFLDGPLALMNPGPASIVGFIKAHHRRYLDSSEEAVLARLACGQRTPLFTFGEFRPRYSWYLRLCERAGDDHAWRGIVRCEAPAALALDEVVGLADASASILPAFASLPHWDPRAPQNLVPVSGLEKRLRHLLGERELVYRMIKSAARRANAIGQAP